MYLTHVTITMPRAGERRAREFYGGVLGLREIVKPEPLQARGGVWFDIGGLELHLSVEEDRFEADRQRHFALACGDVDGLKAKVQAAGVPTADGCPAPYKRFFVLDPFGNRIEIHAPKGLQALD
jgi:catechol 2,3-dioxygenase-like lactoylglutathione lyase family enzyme